jgi:hypothetical protein
MLSRVPLMRHDRRSPSNRSARVRPAWVLLAALSAVGFAHATPAGVPDSLRACMLEQDDGRRLACYDRELARAEKSYGLTDEQKRKLDPAPAHVDAKSQSLSSKVTAVTLRADGRNVINLENGQSWIQGEAFDQTAIRVGDAVTIKPEILGSLYMYFPSKSRTRVTREQ